MKENKAAAANAKAKANNNNTKENTQVINTQTADNAPAADAPAKKSPTLKSLANREAKEQLRTLEMCLRAVKTAAADANSETRKYLAEVGVSVSYVNTLSAAKLRDEIDRMRTAHQLEKGLYGYNTFLVIRWIDRHGKEIRKQQDEKRRLTESRRANKNRKKRLAKESAKKSAKK